MNGDVKVADLGLMVEGDEGQTGMAGSKYWMVILCSIYVTI